MSMCDVTLPKAPEPPKKNPTRIGNEQVAYISGPITGVENYWMAFDACAEWLSDKGVRALNPTDVPFGLTKAQYMRIDFAMIDSADVVVFLPGWEKSKGAQLERMYCEYIDKPVVFAAQIMKKGGSNGKK